MSRSKKWMVCIGLISLIVSSVSFADPKTESSAQPASPTSTGQNAEKNKEIQKKWLEFFKLQREHRWDFEDKQLKEERAFQDEMREQRHSWELKQEREMEKAEDFHAARDAFRKEKEEKEKDWRKKVEDHRKKMDEERKAFREKQEKAAKDFKESLHK